MTQKSPLDSVDVGTVEFVTVEMGRMVEPLGAAAQKAQKGNPKPLKTFLDQANMGKDELGNEADEFRKHVKKVAAPWKTIYESVIVPIDNGKKPSVGQIGQCAKALYKYLKALDEAHEKAGPKAKAALEEARVVGVMLTRYLERHYPKYFAVFCLLGVIVERGPDKPPKVDPAALPEALLGQVDVAGEVFDWGKPGFQAFKVFYYLATLLEQTTGGVNLPKKAPWYKPADVRNTTDFVETAEIFQLTQQQGNDPDFNNQLDLRVSDHVQVQQGSQTFETVLSPVPWTPLGLALVLHGPAHLGKTFDLGTGWKLETDATAKGKALALAAKPGSGASEVGVWTFPGSNQWRIPPQDARKGPEIPDIKATTRLYRTGGNGTPKLQVFGTGESGMFLTDYELITVTEYSDGKGVFRGEAPVKGFLRVKPDGPFLAKILPSEVKVNFHAVPSWSSQSGFAIEGGGNLQASIRLHLKLGPVTVTEIYLELAPAKKKGAFDVVATLSGDVKLGPAVATVKRMGVAGKLAFPDQRDGNLGTLDLDQGFKPPTGLGIGLTAGPVEGGGYIEFQPDKNRYAGTLQLEFSSYAITAVGLLKTELPGGRQGYSFLILITASLPPIQLGFGFTLDKIGGLAGVHRGMRRKPLGKAVRSGNIDSVLFPKNVVANAQEIISDLRSIFPPTADIHVVGPMAGIGWGSPTLMTMELGIVLKISTRDGFQLKAIALAGAIHVKLPEAKKALVDLNLAVLGYIDFGKRRLSIDASLYDSRILAWTVSGDMAMRLKWGQGSRFLLSLGGFHPKYDPPQGFPKVDRIKACLSADSGNPRIVLKGYMAITPNTFQVGASVALHASIGPASVDGFLGFDALFHFGPFRFLVTIEARLSATVKGKGLRIKVTGKLSGPSPMHVQGKAKISLGPLKVKPNFSITIGQDKGKEELPTARIMPKLLDELEKPGNWKGQLPEGEPSLVQLRGEDGDSGEVEILVHPLGGIAVRQTVVPLDETIEKFGNAVPTDFEKFKLSKVTVTSGPTDRVLDIGDLQERFAPAKYRKMSDSEKMNAPAFVERAAGKAAGGDHVYVAGENGGTDVKTAVTLEYETSVIDEEEGLALKPLGQLGPFVRYDLHPMDTRFGLPPYKLSRLIPESASGQGGPTLQGGFQPRDAPVYGSPTAAAYRREVGLGQGAILEEGQAYQSPDAQAQLPGGPDGGAGAGGDGSLAASLGGDDALLEEGKGVTNASPGGGTS